MRIGICTQPLGLNYGGILQNYALQTVLKRMGHEVWTFDIGKYRWIDWLDNAWRVLAHKLLGHKVRPNLTPSQRIDLEKPLRCFVCDKINLTSPRTKLFTKAMVNKYNLNTIVVGSDQTWRPRYNAKIEDLFLNFVRDMPLKRIAYAASFGTEEWEYTDHETAICAKLAKQFDAISVRENSGVKLCAEKLGVDALHVLDPTMLLTADDYIELCKNTPVREPFVFAYILNKDEHKIVEINHFALEHNLPCITMQADNSIQPEDSVEKWLSLFRDAAYVITDSFHGTIFSIIFNKEFYVFGNKSRGNSRFDSLLGLLNLEDRMLTSNHIENKDIDWDRINNILNAAKELSYAWLDNSLNN